MKKFTAPAPRKSRAAARTLVSPSPRKKLYTAIAAQLLALSAPVFAGPEGGVIVGGSGSIDQGGSVTTVNQATDRLAIDWNSFDVAADEQVNFVQPGVDSVALNRILGGSASTILGQINANGQVVLMNTNGILFGEGATINVGGLVASGLAIDPNEFMNGDFALSSIEGADGSVVNAGLINASTGGRVVLVGEKVENKGLISATLGSVTLAAGKEAFLSFDSTGMLGVKVTKEVLQDEIGVDAAVQNSGDINAEGGRVLISGSVSEEIFTKAVNAGNLNSGASVVMHDDGSFTLGGGADVVNTGKVDVSSDSGNAGEVVVLGENIDNSGAILADASSGIRAGSIEVHAADTNLVSGQGKVSASAQGSGDGGDVKILGDKVGLMDDAQVLATGANGGGSIMVGGDQEGKNALVRNAEFVYIGENSATDASATQNGDGGRLITFAEDTARIHGGLYAKGGAQGGDGGFIETSGKKGFVIESIPDTSAANGKAGEWLIDPINLYIVDVDTDGGLEEDGGTFTAIDPEDQASYISVQTLADAFDTNDDVTLKTGDGGSDQGDIIVYDVIAGPGVGQSLTLDAHNSVVFIWRSATPGLPQDTGISASGGDLTMIARAGNVRTATDDVLISSGGGDIEIEAANGVFFGPTSTVNTDGGILSVNVDGGNFSLEGDIEANGGLVSIQAPGNIRLAQGSSITTDGGDFTVFGGGGPSSNDFHADINTGGGDYIVDIDGYYNNAPAGLGHNVTTNGGDIDITTELYFYGSGSTFDTTGGSGTGDVSIHSISDGLLMPVLNAKGDVLVRAESPDSDVVLAGGDVSVGRSLTIRADRKIGFSCCLIPLDSYTYDVGGATSLRSDHIMLNMIGAGTGDAIANFDVGGIFSAVALGSTTDPNTNREYAIDLFGSSIQSDGRVVLNASAGPIVDTGATVVAADSLTLTAGSDLVLEGDYSTSGATFEVAGRFLRDTDFTTQGDIRANVSEDILILGDLATSGGDVDLRGSGGVNVRSLISTEGGNVNLQSVDSGYVQTAGSLMTQGGNVFIDAVTAYHGDSGDTINTRGGSGTGNVEILGTTDITIPALDVKGSLIAKSNVDDNRSITLAGDQYDVSGDFTLETGGDINVNGEALQDTGLISSKNVALKARSVSLENATTGATFGVSASENLTIDTSDSFLVVSDLSAGGPLSLSSSNDIVVNSNASLLGSSEVTITTPANIDVSGSISAQGPLSVTSAAGDISLSNDITGGGGAITLSAANSLSLGGDILSSGGNVTINGSLDSAPDSLIDTLGGSGEGHVKFSGNSSVYIPEVRSKGDLSVEHTSVYLPVSDLEIGGDFLIPGAGNVSYGSADPAVDTSVTVAGNVDISAQTLSFYSNAAGRGIADWDVGGSFSARSSSVGGIDIRDTSIVSNGLMTFFVNDSDGATGTVVTDANTSITETGSEGISVTTRGNFDNSGALSTQGPLSITADGDITLNGPITVEGAANIVSTTGGVTDNGALNLTGPVTVNGAGDVILSSNLSLSNADFNVTAGGGLNAGANVSTGGGDINISSVADFGFGGSEFSSNGGDINLASSNGDLSPPNITSEGGNVSVVAKGWINLYTKKIDTTGGDGPGDVFVSSADDSAMAMPGGSIKGDLTLEVGNGGIFWNNLDLTVGGNLDVLSGGQLGFYDGPEFGQNLTVGGDANLAASAVSFADEIAEEFVGMVLEVSGDLNVDASGSSSDLASVDYGIDLRDSEVVVGGSATLTAETGAILTDANSSISVDCCLRITSSETLDAQGTFSSSDVMLFRSTAGDISLSGSGISNAGSLELDAAGDITVQDALVTSGADISLTAGGAATLEGNVNTGGGNFTALVSGGAFTTDSIVTGGGNIDIVAVTFGSGAGVIFDTTGVSTAGTSNVSIVTTGQVTSPTIDAGGTGNVYLETRSEGITSGEIRNADQVTLVGSSSSIEAAGIEANSLDIYARWPVTQTGAWTISGNTHLDIGTGGADVTLDNPGNDFNTISATTSAAPNSIVVVDSNDISIQDITGFNGLSITAENATFSGSVDGGSTQTVVTYAGSNASNTVTFDSGATFANIDSASLIDLGAGNDTVNISASTPINILGGDDDDLFNILADNLTLGVLDGGQGTDTLDGGSQGIQENYFAEIAVGNSTFNQVNIESFLSNGVESGSELVGVDGFDARWEVNSDDTIHVVVYDDTGAEVDRNTFSGKTLLTGADGDDEFVYSSAVSSIATIDGQAGSDTLSFAAVSDDLTWDLSSTANDVQGVTGFSEIETVIGGAGDDTFLLNNPTILSSLDGGSGTNSIIMLSSVQENNWNINAADAGDVNGLDFVRIGSVTGSDGVDHFVFTEDGMLSGGLAGGGGSDSLVFDTEAAQANGTETMIGVLGDGTTPIEAITVLDGSDTNLLFSGVESIIGGSGDDQFTLNDGRAQPTDVVSIDGGDGQNTLQGEDADNAWTLESSQGTDGGVTGSLNGALNFTQVHTLIGGSAEDTLESELPVGEDFYYAWSTNSMTGLSREVGVRGFQLVEYSGIEHFVGGDADDRFDYNDQFVSVDGGGGNNEIGSFADEDLTWSITGANTGSVESLIFTNIQTVSGWDGIDTINLEVGSSLKQINTGAGADTITFAGAATVGRISTGDDDDVINLAEGVLLSGVIDGGDGTDVLNTGLANTTIDYQNNIISGTTTLNTLGIEQTNSDGEGIVLFGGDGANDWVINADGTVTLTKLDVDPADYSFSNVVGVIGGTGADEFEFTDSVRLSGGVTGGGGDDTLTANTDENLQWVISGANSGTLTNGSGLTIFDEIVNLIGGSDSDVFTVAAGGSVTGSVSGGDGDDILTLADTGASASWTLAGANNATNITEFSQIESLVSQSTAGDVFNINGSTDVLSIAAGSGGGSVVWNAGFLQLDLSNSTINNLLAFSGVNQFDATAATNNVLVATDADNEWVLSSADTGTLIGTETVSFSGFTDLRGGSGDDTLTGANEESTWLIEGVGSGSVQAVSGTTLFSNIEGLAGGDQNDHFIVAAADVEVANGIVGGAGENTLTAFADRKNTWSIDGINRGSLNGDLSFTEVQNIEGGDLGDTFAVNASNTIGNITGGAGADSFTVAEDATTGAMLGGAGDDAFVVLDRTTVGLVDGGDGTDSLDMSDLSGATVVDYLGNTDNGVDFVNVESSILNEETTFDGGDGNNRWVISGDGSGELTKLDGPDAGTYTFSNAFSVRGGDGEDDFILTGAGNVKGTIDGGGAGNSLAAKDVINEWIIDGINGGTLTAEDGTRATFRNIAQIIGADTASDSFTVQAGALIANINAGADSLNDRLTMDQMSAASWTLGGGADEVLIGGNTLAFSGLNIIEAGTGDDVFNIVGAGASLLEVHGRGGSDSLNLASLSQELTVDLANQTAAWMTATGFENVQANAASTNRLIGLNEQASWSLSDTQSGSVNYQTGGTIQYSGFAEIQGGSAEDVFNVTSQEAPALVDGAGGLDTLNASNGDNIWALDATGGQLNATRFTRVEVLNGSDGIDDIRVVAVSTEATEINAGLGANQLTGFDQSNSWIVANDDSGTLNGDLNFTGVETFYGGAQDDTFSFAEGSTVANVYAGAGNDSVTFGKNSSVGELLGQDGEDFFSIGEELVVNGSVDGGAGSNTIDFSDYTVATSSFDVAELVGFDFLNFATVIEPEFGVYAGGDGTNFWYITGVDKGRLEVMDGENAGVYEFDEVHTLEGGTGRDVFIFASDDAAISKELIGGEGEGNVIDMSAQTLVNQWLLDGFNSGNVSNSANPDGNVFSGIASIIGSSGDDTFMIANAEALPSSIDGGLGNDIVNIRNVAIDLSVNLDGSNRGVAGAMLQLANINELAANNNQNHQILGASDQGYTWVVDQRRAGSMQTSISGAGESMRYSGVSAILGGAHDDIFQVSAATDISIDGGEAVNSDFVDYSQVNGNVTINLADSLNGSSGQVTGVEGLRGNNSGVDSLNDSIIIAADTANTWTISDFDGAGIADGVNDGQVNDGNQTVSFIDFNILRGGSDTDTFNQVGGILEGRIEAGDGNDVLNVSLPTNENFAIQNSGTTFVGGQDTDTIYVTGGSTNLSAIYTANDGGGEFEFAEGSTRYVVAHEDVEFLNEETEARSLEIRGSNANDRLSLANGRFGFDSATLISHGLKDNLTINMSGEDLVELTDNIQVTDSFNLVNAAMITNDSERTSITAENLVLTTSQDVGSSYNRIRTSVDNISLENVVGDVYLQEQNGANLLAATTTGVLDIYLVNGDLLSEGSLASTNDFTVRAGAGSVSLTGSNALEGELSVDAQEFALNNETDTLLAAVNVDSMALTVNGDLTQNNAINIIGETALNVEGDIDLTHPQNDFNSLSVAASDDVHIVDENTLTTNKISSGGDFKIESDGLNINQEVTAKNIDLNAGDGSVTQAENSSLSAEDEVNVEAKEGVTISVIAGNKAVKITTEGEVIDGNGDGINVETEDLVVVAKEGLGNGGDKIETKVRTIDASTEGGDVGLANSGSNPLEVKNAKTNDGSIGIDSEGSVEVEGGAIVAGGRDSKVTVTTGGDLTQTGDTSRPGIIAENVDLSAQKGNFGEGGFRVEAERVRVKARQQVGELITPPGTAKDTQFSNSFTFEDQLLVVEQFQDISPAVFSNVKGYFYNDVSIKLSADQLYDEDEDDEEY